MVKKSWFVLLSLLLYWQPGKSTIVVEYDVNSEWRDNTHYEYPKKIPIFPVRLDQYSKEPVNRGQFEKFEHSSPWILLNDTSKKVSLSQFKATLQCARREPSINGGRGIIDILKMLPPTREIAQQVCTYVDVGWSWDGCKKSFDDIIANKRCRGNGGKAKLFRVLNGQLYSDWPWCVVDDGAHDNQRLHITGLLMHVLDYVSDMKDCAFLVAAEKSILPFLKPFPCLSNSGEIHKTDIPWPWHTNTKTEFELYTHSKQQKNFKEDMYRSKLLPHYLEWSQRTAKALYLDDLMSINLILFAQAAARPDLIEARWTCENNCDVEALDPTADENLKNILSTLKGPEYGANSSVAQQAVVDKKLVGHLSSLTSMYISRAIHPHYGQYKYVVVLSGDNGATSSKHLANILAHSGAVVLLGENIFDYFFSGRLQPWVHYVPLSYTAADLTYKIEWLKAHDDMARQIADNARNFGTSYLRLEDHFCYAATVLETLADIMKNTDINIPFNPRPVIMHNKEKKDV